MDTREDGLESSLEAARARLASGATPESLVGWLRDSGLSIMESIIVLRAAAGLSLGRAKEIVSSDPAWTAVVAANATLHEAIIEACRKCGDVVRDDGRSVEVTSDLRSPMRRRGPRSGRGPGAPVAGKGGESGGNPRQTETRASGPERQGPM